MPLQAIGDAVAHKVDYFYDVEFPPLRHSIYSGNSTNPLDIYVHWRRP
jgi:hypothetical protein